MEEIKGPLGFFKEPLRFITMLCGKYKERDIRLQEDDNVWKEICLVMQQREKQ